MRVHFSPEVLCYVVVLAMGSSPPPKQVLFRKRDFRINSAPFPKNIWGHHAGREKCAAGENFENQGSENVDFLWKITSWDTCGGPPTGRRRPTAGACRAQQQQQGGPGVRKPYEFIGFWAAARRDPLHRQSTSGMWGF